MADNELIFALGIKKMPQPHVMDQAPGESMHEVDSQHGRIW